MTIFIKIFIILSTLFFSFNANALPNKFFNASQIAYHDSGHGEPIILIHAFPTDKDLFEPQVAALQKHYRVITLDLWGFGDSAKTDGRMISMAEYADEVRMLMDKLSIPHAVVGGESMGGYIALALLKAHPERIKALILSDTQTDPDDKVGRANREKFAELLLKQGPATLQRAFLSKALMPNAPLLTKNFLKHIVENQSAAGMASAWRGMLERPDMAEVLANSHVPTLIISGSHDEVITPEKSIAMHKLAQGSTLILIPNAAHLSNLDQPELWNQSVERFLESS